MKEILLVLFILQAFKCKLHIELHKEIVGTGIVDHIYLLNNWWQFQFIFGKLVWEDGWADHSVHLACEGNTFRVGFRCFIYVLREVINVRNVLGRKTSSFGTGIIGTNAACCLKCWKRYKTWQAHPSLSKHSSGTPSRKSHCLRRPHLKLLISSFHFRLLRLFFSKETIHTSWYLERLHYTLKSLC